MTFETKEQAERHISRWTTCSSTTAHPRRFLIDARSLAKLQALRQEGRHAEDGNEAGERGARREGRVNREFVAGDGRTYEIRVRRWATSAAGPPPIAAKDGGENRARRRHDRKKTTEDGTRGYAANEVEAGTAIDAEMRTAIGEAKDGSRDRRRDGDRDGDRDRDRHRKKDCNRERSRSRDRDRKKDRRRDRAGGSRDVSRRDGGDERRREDAPTSGAGRAAQTRRMEVRKPPRDAPGRTSTTIRAGVVIDRGGRRRSRRRVFARKSGVSPRDD